MSLFDNLFGDETGTENQPSLAEHERFPEDEYGVAYAVSVYDEDISAVNDLLEVEKNTPRTESPLIREVLEESDIPMGDSVEEYRTDIDGIMERWRDQMESDPDSVWWPIGADIRFELYLSYCEKRAEVESDPFELPQSIGRVLSLLERCQIAHENDAKLAVLPREYIPLEEDIEGRYRGF
ncbi:hypothetical protein [Halorussus lipolyticus]|uniref:hypothetical protein n=1 Tax=Halorussus lipolyticus TaxID=3034024 RepID=UPI0023E876C3|nr:hypothetical protein [Halorussus sp. DT80]